MLTSVLTLRPCKSVTVKQASLAVVVLIRRAALEIIVVAIVVPSRISQGSTLSNLSVLEPPPFALALV